MNEPSEDRRVTDQRAAQTPRSVSRHPPKGIAERISRVLLWDIGPWLSWLRTLLTHPLVTFRPRSTWRVATWWPSESASAVQRSLLRILAVAHQERLDLPTLLQNFADEHRGFRRFRLQRLAKRVAAGTPIVDSLEQTPDVLRDQDVLALRFASQSGILTDVYRDLLNAPETDRRLAKAAIIRVVMYAAAMTLAVVLIVSFLGNSVAPKIAQMAEEFGVMVPPSIHTLKLISRWLSDFAWLWILMAGLFLLVFVSGRVRRVFRRGFSDWRARLGLSSRSAELLRLLSLATDAGRPISGALSTLGRYHFDKVIRQRLLFIRNEVEQGAEAWDCLREAKFITSNEADAIRQCSDGKSQAWLLRQLAIARETTTTTRYQRIAAWGQPVIVLIGAAVVSWLSVGHFQFISQLLNELQRWQASA